VRGSTYLGLKEYAEARIPGGFAAVVARLPDTKHRAYAEQVFLPVGLYDLLPLLPLTEAAAQAEGVPYETSVRGRARLIAARDISTLYKQVLRAPSPEDMIERLQRTAQRYFYFGEVTMEVGERRAALVQTGMPRPMVAWFVPMFEGYGQVVLEHAGARSPGVRTMPPRRDGEQAGIETVTMRVELSWQ
jgi:hypothetical protein